MASSCEQENNQLKYRTMTQKDFEGMNLIEEVGTELVNEESGAGAMLSHSFLSQRSFARLNLPFDPNPSAVPPPIRASGRDRSA